MATTTYSFGPLSPGLLLNNLVTAGQQGIPVVASNAAGTGYFGLWTSNPGDRDVMGRFVTAAGVPAMDEVLVGSPAPGGQYHPSLAGLADGRFVAAYTDSPGYPLGNIHVRLINADGSPGAGVEVTAGPLVNYRAATAGLSDGGFAVTWAEWVGGAHYDLRASIYNADGSVREALAAVNLNAANNAAPPAIARLAGGGFVVAWSEIPAAGGDSEVRFRRFDANGTALDGTDSAGVLIDTAGSINNDIHVAGLPDCGFVVAYADNGWGNGIDITARVYNADGTPRSVFLNANSSANGGLFAGDQVDPAVTVLPNGYFVVGWIYGSSVQVLQAYDPLGNALGQNTNVAFNAHDGAIAALNSGVIAHVWLSDVTDGSGDSFRTGLWEFARLITGNGDSETITGVGDGIWEVIRGQDGDDVLQGMAGRDTLQGGVGFDYASYTLAPGGVAASLAEPAGNTGDAASDTYQSIEGLIGSSFDDVLAGDAGGNVLRGGDGNDILAGGGEDDLVIGDAGNDTAAFAENLARYRLKDFGSKIESSGPEGTDTLCDIEHLQFADATLAVVDDGNALFDALYYYSGNTDVFFAGVGALDHFNAFGWHEGRDPNALFDTSGYRAVNKDVSGNPLDHYHHSGWKEGRDPSADFDTTLYLLRNPDAAAAGVDPLEHFLAFGYAEGRAAYAAVGPAVGGFDAQYYLFHNPDVAAAGVDPLMHFNIFGWHEGRNPNGWFDTAGYLAHYGDVAAAGANPLEHYELFGWREGRDPSAGFDTLGYLAANPDVAAANVNPLEHFLMFGIYEGRQAVNDGVWH